MQREPQATIVESRLAIWTDRRSVRHRAEITGFASVLGATQPELEASSK
jgi:hypothetical protein